MLIFLYKTTENEEYGVERNPKIISVPKRQYKHLRLQLKQISKGKAK